MLCCVNPTFRVLSTEGETQEKKAPGAAWGLKKNATTNSKGRKTCLLTKAKSRWEEEPF